MTELQSKRRRASHRFPLPSRPECPEPVVRGSSEALKFRDEELAKAFKEAFDKAPWDRVGVPESLTPVASAWEADILAP